MISIAVLILCAGSSLAQFVCPPDGGFYADPNQCDKYYDCYRGDMTEKFCPDGLVFDASLAPKLEQCNYPFIVPCPENSVLQPAIPSGIECPRLNGYFEHEEPSNCVDYYECSNGIAVKRMCSEGLVFDEFSGSCQWEHKQLRTGCTSHVETLEDGFTCPTTVQLASNGHELDHARYVNNEDCRYFYVCSLGKYPSVVGCPEGTVFNDVNLNCDAPENVAGCENYYEQSNTGPRVQGQQGAARP